MRYGKLSKLILVLEKEGGGKMNTEEHYEIILDREMFNFWIESSKELEQVVIMEHRVGYYKEYSIVRRKQL